MPGVAVMTRSHEAPEQHECAGVVTGISKRIAPIVLWVTLATGQTLGVTPGHEFWTRQRGWTYASHVQLGETMLDSNGHPVEIVAVELDRTPTEMFDIEVDGTFTYFVEGVWVHNAYRCPLSRRGAVNQAYGESFELAIREMNGLLAYTGPKLHSTVKGKQVGFKPDFLQSGMIGDIKGGEYVHLTPQLEAMGEFARQNGLQAVLYAGGDVASTVRQYFQVIKVP
jgi:hypothetical protein